MGLFERLEWLQSLQLDWYRPETWLLVFYIVVVGIGLSLVVAVVFFGGLYNLVASPRKVSANVPPERPSGDLGNRIASILRDVLGEMEDRTRKATREALEDFDSRKVKKPDHEPDIKPPQTERPLRKGVMRIFVALLVIAVVGIALALTF